jgi:predicted ATPase
VSQKYAIKHLAVCAKVLSGFILTLTDDPPGGVAHMKQAVSEFQSQQAGVGVPFVLGLIADGHLRAGRAKDAQMAVAFAMGMAAREGEGQSTAELHRLKGQALAMSGAAEEAEASIREAIAIAGRQGALALRLRAAIALARLLRARGDAAAAQACLAPVYAEFTEGFGTRDLTEARALLDALSAPAQPIAAASEG